MKAAFLAVGSELLGLHRLDTNSLRTAALLERYGVQMVGKSVVGDDEAAIGRALRHWMAETQLVVVSGGLGPTADDVTRAAVATALGRGLSRKEELVAALRRRFAAYGRPMPEANLRQADVIDGAEVITNPHGSAPAMRLQAEATTIFLFPGVPRELQAMLEADLEPWLQAHSRDGDGRAMAVERRVLKVACLPESEVEDRITPAYERFGRHDITVLANPGDLRIEIIARGTDEARRERLDTMQEALAGLVGRAVYACDGEATLEGVVGEALTTAGRTVVTAESCTGGLVAERLTRVAGSSAYVLGGVVAYSNGLKTALLGVPAALIASQGAVSEEVARAMATGARQRYGADYALAITGIAGPGGGSEEKPVGTVHVALAGPADDACSHRLLHLPGERDRVRWLTSQVVLDMLRRALLADAEVARA